MFGDDRVRRVTFVRREFVDVAEMDHFEGRRGEVVYVEAVYRRHQTITINNYTGISPSDSAVWDLTFSQRWTETG